MVILTCANIDVATEKYKDEYGKYYRNFSFKNVIQETMKKAHKCGYTPDVYDLGELGIGEPFQVADESFRNKGYYEVEIQKGYKSRSLFKPELVRHCLQKHNDIVAYLDGDAQLMSSIDEVATNDYDVGVTLRKASELESEWHREHFEIARYANAGVIFFNPTPAAFRFVDAWETRTKEVGNDQKALNQLVCPEHYPGAYSVISINDVRIKYFPCEQYNYYYFEEGLERDIKIMHFKGMYRQYFPFDWKKRLYCMMIIPAMNAVKPVLKKILSTMGKR